MEVQIIDEFATFYEFEDGSDSILDVSPSVLGLKPSTEDEKDAEPGESLKEPCTDWSDLREAAYGDGISANHVPPLLGNWLDG
jgi:hypothetical protein